VISSTANAYSNWVAATQKLQLAEQTLNGRVKSYELIKLRESIGIASALDLAQAEVAKVTVEAQKAQNQRALSDAKSALELLVGTPINAIIKGQILGPRMSFNFNIPDNLSSKMILARPDVIAAEERLRATNANIGAARAAFLPSISLTANAGFASGDLSNLFKSDSRTWSFIPAISIPLFGNANDANLDVAKARQEKGVAEYEKAIQQAFSEVYTNVNARVARSSEIDANQRLVKAENKRLSLATARYDAGLSSYIEVLDAQQNLFTAQQSLLESERGKAQAIIELYRALGGGDELKGSFRSRLSPQKES
jgi:NodT family efflux transporter outer membrane factor (OMF) lipoprotein